MGFPTGGTRKRPQTLPAKMTKSLRQKKKKSLEWTSLSRPQAQWLFLVPRPAGYCLSQGGCQSLPRETRPDSRQVSHSAPKTKSYPTAKQEIGNPPHHCG